jgi:hypothetical protein
MVLQTSGTISLSQIQTEFGGTDPIGMSEYYANDTGLGLNISSQYSIPASGAIAMSNFYGAQKFNLYTTTTFVTTVTNINDVSINVSSTSSLKDRWIIVCFGGWNADLPFNILPSISFTAGVTGTITTPFNVYSYPGSDGFSNAISYQKITEGATSITARCTNPIYRTGGGVTADGTTPVPINNDYGNMYVSVFVVSGIPTLTHYGLVSSAATNNVNVSITLNATSTRSFGIFTAWRNTTPFTMTNATYYSNIIQLLRTKNDTEFLF